MKQFIKKNKKGIIGTIFLVLFQSALYLITKLFQTSPTLIGGLKDYSIPFIPKFIYIYIFWYLLIFIVPIILYIKDKFTYYKYFTTYIICIILSDLIFIIYPTTIIRPTIASTNITETIINLVYQLDTPVLNCLPSLHCLVSFLFIYCSINNNKIKIITRIIFILSSLLIILSTLFVKQHVIIDIVSAFIISLPIWLIISKNKIYLKVKKYIEKETS